MTDLLSVLEKVRRLGYTSSNEFKADLAILRVRVNMVITELTDQTTHQVILQAFDTMIHTADTVLSNRADNVATIEMSILGIDSNEPDRYSKSRCHWRRECSLLAFPLALQCRIPARPLDAWARFLVDGSSLTMVRERDGTDNETKKEIERYLGTLGINDLTSDKEVALLLTTFADPMLYSQSCTTSNSVYSSFSMSRDETMDSLDALNELTRRLTKIQSDLRKKHAESKKFVNIDGSNVVVTVGEGNALAELKLSNDALRWKLQQKHKALLASTVIINDLKRKNNELMEALEWKEKQSSTEK